MRNIRLTIQYDGTNYSGWQFQKNAKSIQGTIERALKSILNENARLIASSRTDAGVHAKGQVANFKTRSRLPLGNIKDALNTRLPKDVAISGIEEVGLDFNSQFDAKSKLYRYAVTTGDFIPPFIRNFIARYPYGLDIRSMRRSARALLGRHDFRSFQTNGSERVRESLRTIKKIGIKEEKGSVYIDIEADGFLYNMARNIAGTLLEVGRGKMEVGDIAKILARKDRRFCGPVAPAKGLCLVRVRF